MAKYQPREEDVAETFIIYADHSGSLPVGSLGTCLRALGWNPSEVEVQVRRSTAQRESARERDRERERDRKRRGLFLG
jgi:Ca2+-binding EF-hand superfamily protein